MTDRIKATQPGLWDENQGVEVPASRSARSRERSRATSTPPTRPAPPVVLPAKRPLEPMDFTELWDIDEVANYLGVPKQTIYSWRQKSYGPQGFRVGKHLRWRAATVVTWTLGLERDG